MSGDPYGLEENGIYLMECRHQDTDLHSHDFLELVYVTGGSAVHVIDGQDTRVAQGDYFVIDYGSEHAYHDVRHTGFTIINCLFLPKSIDKALVGCRSFRELLGHPMIRFQYNALEDVPARHVYHDADGRVLALLQTMEREQEERRPGWQELLRCYLIETLILTMRGAGRQTVPPEKHQCSRYIRAYVDEHYMQAVTLTELAARLHYSVPYLSRTFKQEVGMPFNAYLQKKRIEESCRLLAGTDKRVEEIAELVGYSDVRFFGRLFRETVHTTPCAFRRICR